MAKQPLPAYRGGDPYIFVSYCHDDDALVGQEIRWLQDHGINVWWDEGISPGAEWREEITTALANASLILYFVSPASVVSPHCIREINYGVDQFRKPVLAVHLQPTILPHGLGMILSNLQALMRHELGPDDYYQKLMSACASYLNVAPPPAAAIAKTRPKPRTRMGRSILASALAVVIGVAALLVWWLQPSSTQVPHARFSVHIPADLNITPATFFEMFFPPPIALSPDGSRIVFSASDKSGHTSLYMRVLEEFEFHPLADTEAGVAPFFSPDGQWIGFAAGRTLKKIPVSGGQAQTIVALGPGAGFGGASWGSDDRIAYAPSAVGGLYVVPAGGADPRRITMPDADTGELGHVMPQWSPSGDSLLFSVRMGLAPESPRVEVLDIDSGKHHLLLENAIGGRLIAGRVIYGGTGDDAESLWAAPYDANSLSLHGRPRRLLEDVAADLYALPFFDTTRNGSLVYIPVGGDRPRDELLWLETNGSQTQVADSADNIIVPAISPDGETIAITIMADTSRELSVWTVNKRRGTPVQFNSGAENDHGTIWAPDGTYLVFTANHEGPSNLYRADLNPPHNLTRLTESPQHQDAGSFSPDGRLLTYAELHPDTNWDLWILDMDDGRTTPFLSSNAEEMQPIISPAGTMIAYTSNETGQREVYLEQFPSGGRKQVVSMNGGEDPVWGPGGNTLYYRWQGAILAVPIDAGGVADDPVEVLTGHFEGRTGYGKANWDVDQTGRILVTSRQPQTLEPQINVILGWPELVDP